MHFFDTALPDIPEQGKLYGHLPLSIKKRFYYEGLLIHYLNAEFIELSELDGILYELL